MLNDDYRDILQNLLDAEAQFLVVGAYAMSVYGYPRATGDIDVWVEATEENSKKVYTALKQFGAPLMDVTENTFAEEGIVFQIGLAPRRIDIITFIDGVDFEEAYKEKTTVEINTLTIPFISKEHLIQNKRATLREKDRLDADKLANHSKELND